MSKNTSMTLGKHFDGFIARQIDSGRFSSASEVVRAALRMFEVNEQKLRLTDTCLKKVNVVVRQSIAMKA